MPGQTGDARLTTWGKDRHSGINKIVALDEKFFVECLIITLSATDWGLSTSACDPPRWVKRQEVWHTVLRANAYGRGREETGAPWRSLKQSVIRSSVIWSSWCCTNRKVTRVLSTPGRTNKWRRPRHTILYYRPRPWAVWPGIEQWSVAGAASLGQCSGRTTDRHNSGIIEFIYNE